jgi:hypothetical protein
MHGLVSYMKSVQVDMSKYVCCLKLVNVLSNNFATFARFNCSKLKISRTYTVQKGVLGKKYVYRSQQLSNPCSTALITRWNGPSQRNRRFFFFLHVFVANATSHKSTREIF